MSANNGTDDLGAEAAKELQQYGGQAVIEGVMMRSPHYYAVACRKPDGTIVVQREHVDKSIIGKLKWLNKPFLRGTLALIDAMALGSRALSFAAHVQIQAEAEEREADLQPILPVMQSQVNEPIVAAELPMSSAAFARDSPAVTRDAHEPAVKPDTPRLNKLKLEEAVAAAPIINTPSTAAISKMPKSGRINDIAVGASFAATLVAVLLFRSIPTLLTEFASHHLPAGMHASNIVLNAFDGIIRISLFFGYILLISSMPQIREVFKYHGAEHKAINTLEAGLPLTRENALQASRIHPRCGTSFIFVVFFVDLLVCLFLPRPVWYLRILLHLAVLPPVAGIAYEVIKFAGKFRRNPFVMAAFAPGMATQYLTTREPTPAQTEVALAALYSVLTAEGHSIPQNDFRITHSSPDPDEPAAALA